MNLHIAKRLADDLIREHAPGWTWTWSRGKTVFGVCQYREQNIKLSKPLTVLNTEQTFAWVVKHEIAHVLAGPEANHGPLFRAHCRALGIKGERCWTKGNDEAVRIEGKNLGTCKQRCGYTTTSHKMTYTAYHRSVCPKCSVRSARHWVYLDWTRDGRPVVEPKKPAPRRRRKSRRYSYR